MPYGRKNDDPERCQQHVTDHTGFGFPQCSRKWTVEDDGKWCKPHSPKAKAARDKKAHDRYEAQDRERRRPFDKLKDFQAALNRIANYEKLSGRKPDVRTLQGIAASAIEKAEKSVGVTGTAGSPADVGSTPTASTNSGRS